MTNLKHAPEAAQALPYGPLSVGMPVIADGTDQPCAMCVAIISGFSGTGYPKLSYFAERKEYSCVHFLGVSHEITPLSAFGMAIELDETRGAFRCVEIKGVTRTAKYFDGTPRWWQRPASHPEWWPYRPAVLRMLDRRFVL
jgi:hypothetical protein